MSWAASRRLRSAATLAVAAALSGAPARAQEQVAVRQQAPETSQALTTQTDDAPLGGLRVTRFRETFGETPLESRRWVVTIGAEIGPPGVRLVAPSGAPVAELRTQPIDLADDAEAELRIDVATSGPAPLTIEYLSSGDRWRLLGELSGPIAGETRSLPLPIEALHPGFRARLRTTARQAAWALTAIAVEGAPRGPAHVVSLRSQPAAGAVLTVVDDPPSGTTQVVAPARIAVAETDPVQVVAPAELDGLPFLRWVLDEVPQAEHKRGLTLHPVRDAAAVAVYRREVSPAVVIVSVRSAPTDGVRVLIGPDRNVVWDEDSTAFALECLAGETVTLQAAPRTQRLLFARWIVDGVRSAEAEPALTLAPTRDTHALAAYVLLGDMNNDNLLDEHDVDPFCLALSRPDEHRRQFGDVRPSERGDVNGDGVFDARDIGAFVELLLSE